MSDLTQRTCEPCRGGVAPLSPDEAATYLSQLDGWSILDDDHLVKDYAFADFATALAFANRVGAIAEREGHHPDVHLAWGRVRIETWTHKIDGLSPSDFILAAKIDAEAVSNSGNP